MGYRSLQLPELYDAIYLHTHPRDKRVLPNSISDYIHADTFRFVSTLVVGNGIPIEFESTDGRPCRAIVLLVSPIDKTGPHIQALANVSRLWQTDGFREALGTARSSDDIYAAISRYEA